MWLSSKYAVVLAMTAGHTVAVHSHGTVSTTSAPSFAAARSSAFRSVGSSSPATRLKLQNWMSVLCADRQVGMSDPGMGVSSSHTTLAPSAFSVAMVEVSTLVVSKVYVRDAMTTTDGRSLAIRASASTRHWAQCVTSGAYRWSLAA